MNEPLNLQGQTKLQVACEATKLLIQQKLLFSKNHEVGIIIMGSDESVNELNEEHGGYDNITVFHELTIPSLESMKLMQDITSTNSNADVLDAIVVAVDMIEKNCGKKAYNKRIFIHTDGNCLCENEEQLQDIINQINVQNIKVNVIAVGFGGDVTDLKQELTDQQRQTEANLRLLVEGCQGAIYPSTTAMQIYKQFRKRSVTARAKFSGQFDLGLGNQIDVKVYGKAAEEKMPSMKKHSTAVQFDDDLEAGKIAITRERALEDDPNSTAIDEDDIINAHHYGKSVVPISKVDEEALKYATSKCLKLLGFLSSHSIPRHFFTKGVEIVLPAGTPDQELAFVALVQALYQREEVCLVRYVFRENAQPRLAVLSPSIKPNFICLYLNYLPTEEDVRDYPFADLAESTPQQQGAAEDFVKSLSLEYTDEDGDRVEALKPSLTFNPTLQYFYQCLTFRAEHPGAPLPALDSNIEEYLRPDRQMFERAKKQCDRFASMFVLKEVQEEPKKKKFYADVLKEEETLKPKEPENRLATEMISEMNPVEDFHRLMKDRDVDRVSSAITQMKGIIMRLVEQSFQGNTYSKAIECLKNLRNGCLDEDEVDQFNNFMTSQVLSFQRSHPDFWNMIVQNRITLISSRESDRSRVSHQQANDYLVRVETSPVGAEADELMEDIE
jgi:ATP-dependent DNA helicase 2 subunit 2